MPKTIDYPRTSYTSAWEVAEVVDDTGGKCAIETCAKKLDRKVSGSFKAIIGSAVKFGLLTSKREILTTTNLYRRIKHAYDKQEEKLFHREAFLHPPLFTQITRKFRNRELPVHMFDVILIREFNVEEINAQGVAKAFVDGARMVDILDERNVVADIDQMAAQQAPRRELASTEMPSNLFGAKTSTPPPSPLSTSTTDSKPVAATPTAATTSASIQHPTPLIPPLRGSDAVSSLFGLDTDDLDTSAPTGIPPGTDYVPPHPSQKGAAPLPAVQPTPVPTPTTQPPPAAQPAAVSSTGYSIHISGPGIESQLSIQDVDDLGIVSILLEKIRKQLLNNQ